MNDLTINGKGLAEVSLTDVGRILQAIAAELETRNTRYKITRLDALATQVNDLGVEVSSMW